jgi:hypothetical protein
MSRYNIDHPTLDIVVGWDNPLQTLFCQVIDPSLDEEEETILWRGTGHPDPEIRTVHQLNLILSPYAQVPDDVAEKLCAEMKAAATPTPLQQLVVGTMRNAREWDK